ncbi:hypothetical protein MBLNU230_g7042t1, partial [Neophaeotheca triangularis]
MAAPRLPFLWPVLFKPTPAPASRASKAAARNRLLHSSSRQRQQNLPQRYGPANEPLPHLRPGKPPPEASKDAKALPKIGERLQKDGEEENKTELDEIEQDSFKAVKDENSSKAMARDPTTIEIPPSNSNPEATSAQAQQQQAGPSCPHP